MTEGNTLQDDRVVRVGLIETANVLILCVSAVLIIGLHRFQLELVHAVGWGVWAVGLLSLWKTEPDFRRNVFLVYLAIAILGFTPINTEVDTKHILVMGATLSVAVAVPYGLSRWVLKDHVIRFKFHHGRRWTRSEILWVVFAIVLSYLLLPFYLSETGAWKNWTVTDDPGQVLRVFIGTNGLGIWDELFFINVCLGIFRRYFTFRFANLAQAVLFTSFLYELGFTGWWGPIMIFIFALLQGITFRNTESLLYVIVIHLSIDLVLFLALVNMHQPQWADIFVTVVGR